MLEMVAFWERPFFWHSRSRSVVHAQTIRRVAALILVIVVILAAVAIFAPKLFAAVAVLIVVVVAGFIGATFLHALLHG
jgi:hypothetical protein